MKCASSLLQQTGRVLLPGAPTTQPKKESERCRALQSAASLTSCQTIPVKDLFRWRPEQEASGECKEEMYTEGGDTLGSSCARRAAGTTESCELMSIYSGM